MDKIDDIVKQVVLAHADGDMQCVAVVWLNKDGEPEIHYAVNNIQAYGVNFGLDVIKVGMISNVLTTAKPSEDRE